MPTCRALDGLERPSYLFTTHLPHLPMASPTAIAGYLALFTIIGAGFLFGNLFLGRFLRPKAPNVEKLEVYECGEPTIGSSFVQFDLRFYVVALLFIIFDVEIAFFFPWANVFGKATNLMDPNFAAVRNSNDPKQPGLELTPDAAAVYRELGVAHPTVPSKPATDLSAAGSASAAKPQTVEEGNEAVRAGASRLALHFDLRYRRVFRRAHGRLCLCVEARRSGLGPRGEPRSRGRARPADGGGAGIATDVASVIQSLGRRKCGMNAAANCVCFGLRPLYFVLSMQGQPFLDRLKQRFGDKITGANLEGHRSLDRDRSRWIAGGLPLSARRAGFAVQLPELHLGRRLLRGGSEEGGQGRLEAAFRGRLSPLERAAPRDARAQGDPAAVEERRAGRAAGGPFGQRHLEHGRLARARGLRPERRAVHRPSQPPPHSLPRRLGRPSASQGLRNAARVSRDPRQGKPNGDPWPNTRSRSSSCRRL